MFLALLEPPVNTFLLNFKSLFVYRYRSQVLVDIFAGRVNSDGFTVAAVAGSRLGFQAAQHADYP